MTEQKSAMPEHDGHEYDCPASRSPGHCTCGADKVYAEKLYAYALRLEQRLERAETRRRT